MKCVNFHCDNDLTEWELKRRHFKLSYSDFCRKCRFRNNWNQAELLRCRDCKGGFLPARFKVYCDDCYRLRRNEQSRINMQRKRDRRKELNNTRLINKQ